MWCVYMLVNQNGRTYIGSTTDVNRRLRQHNGEIRGGARSTKQHGPWELYCYLSGFENRSAACRWEKIIKSRARGLNQRFQAFQFVRIRHCPQFGGKPRPVYEVPANLVLALAVKYKGPHE